MRYDRQIFFVKEKKEYDPETGDYRLTDAAEESAYCSLVNSSKATMEAVYGGIRKDSVTVHLPGVHKRVFDYVKIDGKKYRMDSYRGLRKAESYVLSGVE